MMKVEPCGPEGTTLKVCGRITSRSVSELAQVWRDARVAHPQQHLAVDLRDVLFVDHAGEELLRAMFREGARFLTGGLLIQEIVNQIMKDATGNKAGDRK